MTDRAVERDQDSGPRVEWAVEVTWKDWKRAGAKGPTSQYGPFETEQHRDRFLAEQRRDRDVAATRVLTRVATYTPWEGPTEVSVTTTEEREELLAVFYRDHMGPAVAYRPDPAPASTE